MNTRTTGRNAAFGTLPPQQQQVVDEHHVLVDQVEQLKSSIAAPEFNQLDEAEKNLIREQLATANAKAAALAETIASFAV